MELLYPKESYKISGAIYEVHKELGPGLLEKVYQEALEKEFKLQNIPYEREKDFTTIGKLQRPAGKTRTDSSVLVFFEFLDVEKRKNEVS